MTTNEEAVAEYWMENPQRWTRALKTAADIATMYELECPDDREFTRLPPWALADRFFWHTTHRKYELTTPMGRTVYDGLVDVAPEYDAPTAWGCTVGALNCWLLTGADLRFILGVSGERVQYGQQIWAGFSEDFHKMFLGLSGDMRKQGLRGLVLGYFERGGNV